MAHVDYDRLAATFDRARGLPRDAIEPWRTALARYLPAERNLRVLDLGSGTGRFSVALADWFGARVIGIEPAAGMRRQARRHPHPSVACVGGRGESIPLRDRSCDAAWLSTVIHHLADLGATARELRRVLRPGGRVFIRGAFPGRHDHIALLRFFPGARRIAETFPSVEHTARAFASVGFAMEGLESVPQRSAPSLRVFAARVRRMRRADSTLAPLSDDEFARDLAALERAAAAAPAGAPVVDRLDLLVLR